MVRRTEKKLKTRAALMNSALHLVEEGQHFSSISIREVAKNAGVVPTSFYRHFKDLDDLALNLVDELSLMLRQLLRTARQQPQSPLQMIDKSIDLLMDYVLDNRAFFIFMTQGLSGGSPAVRDAIRSELRFFANELELDLKRQNTLGNLDSGMYSNVCQLVINAMAMVVAELLDFDEKDLVSIQSLKERTRRQLQVIFLGAAHWRVRKDVADAEPDRPLSGSA